MSFKIDRARVSLFVDQFFVSQSQALLKKKLDNYFNIIFSDCVNVNSHSGIYDAAGNREYKFYNKKERNRPTVDEFVRRRWVGCPRERF